MITKINGNTHITNNTCSSKNSMRSVPTFKGSAHITCDIAKEALHKNKYNGFAKKCQNFMQRTVLSKGEPLFMELFNLSDSAKSTFKCAEEFDNEFEVLAKEFADKNKFKFSFEHGANKNLKKN